MNTKQLPQNIDLIVLIGFCLLFPVFSFFIGVVAVAGIAAVLALALIMQAFKPKAKPAVSAQPTTVNSCRGFPLQPQIPAADADWWVSALNDKQPYQ